MKEKKRGGPYREPPFFYARNGLVVVGAAEEAEDNAGGDPIVILMNVGAEGGPVVVHVEEADFPVRRGVEVNAAADFVGEAVAGNGVAAGAGDGGIRAGGSEESLHKRCGAPTISRTMEITRAVMISVKDILGGAGGNEAVAAIANNLQPRLEIQAERAEPAVHVRPISSATVETRKSVAAEDFDPG